MTKEINTNTSEVKEHSEFGGSQAERIMNCPGSVILSRGIPNKSNAAADKGTATHACVEFFIRNHKKLKTKKQRTELIDLALEMKTEGIPWDMDMVDNALNTLSWVKEKLQPGSKVFVEAHLDSSAFTTVGQFSTLDIAIANFRARELIIADYKNGTHPVEVENNSQLIYYALAMLLKLGINKFDRVKCVIIQPNAYHKDGEIREWITSVEDTIAWGKKFRKTVKIALKPKAPLKYGNKWCFFCLAKKKCPVMKQRMADKDFADL